MATQHIFTINDVYRKSLEGTWVAQGWGYGWFSTSTPGALTSIQRISFATDTAASSLRGNMAVGGFNLGAVGNFNDGWWGGGYTPSTSPSTSSRVERVIFSSDTALAVAKGPLAVARFGHGGASNSTDGWFTGGGNVSNSQRVIFSSDTATAVQKGSAPQTFQLHSTVDDFSASGWNLGGFNPSVVAAGMSIVSRMIFASDTAANVNKGNLTGARYNAAGVKSGTSGYSTGGFFSPPSTALTTVDKIIFASDTAAAVAKGPLTVARVFSDTGLDSTSNGYAVGGYSPASSNNTTIVDRIIFATDTATATAAGNLSVATYNNAAP